MSGTTLKKWEEHEDALLIMHMKEGNTYEEIAKKFKTTVNGVKERVICKIILPEYSENIKELAEKYKFEDSEYLKRRLECNQKKEATRKKKLFTDEKYFEILQNIIERLDRIEKK
jgi:hypothetical protein